MGIILIESVFMLCVINLLLNILAAEWRDARENECLNAHALYTGAGCYITAFGWPQLVHGCVTINRKRTWRLVCPCGSDACAACLLLLSSVRQHYTWWVSPCRTQLSLTVLLVLNAPKCASYIFLLKIYYWDSVCMANYSHLNKMRCDYF